MGLGCQECCGSIGVSLWCQQVGGTKGVRSVIIAMVSGVAMVPKMSLGVSSVGGLRTFIGYLRAVRSLEAKR